MKLLCKPYTNQTNKETNTKKQWKTRQNNVKKEAKTMVK
jgi:hypothetical protein